VVLCQSGEDLLKILEEFVFWRAGLAQWLKSARLPPMCPGVEFVFGALLCSEKFFSGYSGFLLPSKTNISKFQFDLDYRQALYDHEPLARVIAQALPVFDVNFPFTFFTTRGPELAFAISIKNNHDGKLFPSIE